MARQSTGELVRRLRDLVHEYDKRICNAEAVGALEFVKAEVIADALEDDKDEED